MTWPGAPVQAVLFDLDGTLLEPGGGIRKSIDHALTSHGHDPFGPEDILIGMPLRDILRLRTDDHMAIESMVQAFRRYFQDEAWRFASWYPGMQEVLSWLHDQGVATAIVTTKGEEEATHLLHNLEASHWFRTIVGDDDTRPLKPHPAPVLEACRRLGVEAQAAVMVGDTRYDTEAGEAAGCLTIGVSWGHGQSDHGPTGAHHLVRDAHELRSILAQLLDA